MKTLFILIFCFLFTKKDTSNELFFTQEKEINYSLYVDEIAFANDCDREEIKEFFLEREKRREWSDGFTLKYHGEKKNELGQEKYRCNISHIFGYGNDNLQEYLWEKEGEVYYQVGNINQRFEPVKLFDFNLDIGYGWLTSYESPTGQYLIRLEDKAYKYDVKDTVYSFSYLLGELEPNPMPDRGNYYPPKMSLSYIEVSKKHGIIQVGYRFKGKDLMIKCEAQF